MADCIQLRGDTAAAWALANPVLAQRELAIETDTLKTKIGDGVTAWNALPYGGIVGPQGPQGVQGPQGETGPQGTTAWGDLTGKPSVFPSNITNVSGLASRLRGSDVSFNFGATGKRSGRYSMMLIGGNVDLSRPIRVHVVSGVLVAGKGPTFADEHELIGPIMFTTRVVLPYTIHISWQSPYLQIGQIKLNLSN